MVADAVDIGITLKTIPQTVTLNGDDNDDESLDLFRCGMASSSEPEEYIKFPCDLPQWDQITQILTELRDNLCLEPSPSLLVKQLDYVHRLVQNPDASPRQDKQEKKRSCRCTVTAGNFQFILLCPSNAILTVKLLT